MPYFTDRDLWVGVKIKHLRKSLIGKCSLVLGRSI
jgi:hypothetical protein